MTELNIEQYVKQQIELMQQQGQEPVAVMMGHEDWLDFSVQSKVAYTPFGSARRYQPALGGLLLVRIDEMNAVRVWSPSRNWMTMLRSISCSKQL